jgi:hypothetical protein
MDHDVWRDRLPLLTAGLIDAPPDEAAALLHGRLEAALHPASWAAEPGTGAAPVSDDVKMWSLHDAETGTLYVDITIRTPPPDEPITLRIVGIE